MNSKDSKNSQWVQESENHMNAKFIILTEGANKYLQKRCINFAKCLGATRYVRGICPDPSCQGLSAEFKIGEYRVDVGCPHLAIEIFHSHRVNADKRAFLLNHYGENAFFEVKAEEIIERKYVQHIGTYICNTCSPCKKCKQIVAEDTSNEQEGLCGECWHHKQSRRRKRIKQWGRLTQKLLKHHTYWRLRRIQVLNDFLRKAIERREQRIERKKQLIRNWKLKRIQILEDFFKKVIERKEQRVRDWKQFARTLISRKHQRIEYWKFIAEELIRHKEIRALEKQQRREEYRYSDKYIKRVQKRREEKKKGQPSVLDFFKK